MLFDFDDDIIVKSRDRFQNLEYNSNFIPKYKAKTDLNSLDLGKADVKLKISKLNYLYLRKNYDECYSLALKMVLQNDDKELDFNTTSKPTTYKKELTGGNKRTLVDVLIRCWIKSQRKNEIDAIQKCVEIAETSAAEDFGFFYSKILFTFYVDHCKCYQLILEYLRLRPGDIKAIDIVVQLNIPNKLRSHLIKEFAISKKLAALEFDYPEISVTPEDQSLISARSKAVTLTSVKDL
eukprot:NODE_4_length_77007_cov_1.156642.p47 type:complete len:237 gc:universal NODE_4_length_77007_cov_1.156642:73461-74171(+)